MENRNLGKKFSRCIRQGHSRDLPTDNKLAESPRKKFRLLRNSESLQSKSANNAPSLRPNEAGRARHSVRAALDLQLTARRGLPALPQLATNCSPSRRRGTRRLSSRFHHRRPNRADPLQICTSRFRRERRTALLNRRFGFHRPGSFSNGWIQRGSAFDIRLARFRWLRNRSVVQSFRSVCPSRSHFFKRERCRGSLVFTGLRFSWRWRRRLRGKFLGRQDCLLWRLRCLPHRLGFFFASNDYFLRMYFFDENAAAE